MPPKQVPIFYDDEPLIDDTGKVIMGEVIERNGRWMMTIPYLMGKDLAISEWIRTHVAKIPRLKLGVEVTKAGIKYYPILDLPGAATEAGIRYSQAPPREPGAGLEGPLGGLTLRNMARGRSRNRAHGRNRTRGRSSSRSRSRSRNALNRLIENLEAKLKGPGSP
jgi:hypothetical protein